MDSYNRNIMIPYEFSLNRNEFLSLFFRIHFCECHSHLPVYIVLLRDRKRVQMDTVQCLEWDLQSFLAPIHTTVLK